jgi:hypothetical protein
MDRLRTSLGRSHIAGEASTMQIVKYVIWKEDEFWLGYLEEFPDYWTQGEMLDDLIEHLKDLSVDMSSGQIPGIRRS